MLNYNPAERNEHIVRVTFDNEGYTGHIAFKLGGNCKGLDVLMNVENFIETCDEDDIKNLVENDCEFRLNEDIETFNISLNGKRGRTILLNAEEETIKGFIVSVEIVGFTPEE